MFNLASTGWSDQAEGFIETKCRLSVSVPTFERTESLKSGEEDAALFTVNNSNPLKMQPHCFVDVQSTFAQTTASSHRASELGFLPH